MIQAAEHLRRAGLLERVSLVGVDLVDAFDPVPSPPDPTLLAASVTAWTPTTCFDLITCVHGLHYIDDKLARVASTVRCLTPHRSARGRPGPHQHPPRRPAGQRLTTRLHAAGIHYDTGRHRITCTGPRELRLPYTYLGADDNTGPNYTGQPAVNSHYRDHL